MGFFDDFENALEKYPETNVKLSINSVAVQTGTSGAVNVNEVWKFKILVDNDGPLNLTNLALRVEGQNGAQVSTSSAGPFGPSVTTSGSGLLAISGHSAKSSQLFYFKAPNVAKPAGTVLAKVRISAYDANLDHILVNHSLGTSTPEGSHEAQVFP